MIVFLYNIKLIERDHQMARTKGTAYVTVVYTLDGQLVSRTVNNQEEVKLLVDKAVANGSNAVIVKGKLINTVLALKSVKTA